MKQILPPILINRFSSNLDYLLNNLFYFNFLIIWKDPSPQRKYCTEIQLLTVDECLMITFMFNVKAGCVSAGVRELLVGYIAYAEITKTNITQ